MPLLRGTSSRSTQSSSHPDSAAACTSKHLKVESPECEEGLADGSRGEKSGKCLDVSGGRSRPPLQTGCKRSGWSGWFGESLSTDAMIPGLVSTAVGAGILDATTYADFMTFASNQTGNTILLTVSVIGTLKLQLLLTGISLVSFLGGAFVFGHLGHYIGPRRRGWIICSTLYQIVLLAISCVLLSPSGPPSTQVTGKHRWAPLFLFATMSGAQVALARQSGSQELPTAPMTSSYVDLVGDKYLFVGPRHPKAGPRNRRLAYILAMIAGGFIGAVLHRYTGSWVVVLVTMGTKAVVLLLYALAKGEST